MYLNSLCFSAQRKNDSARTPALLSLLRTSRTSSGEGFAETAAREASTVKPRVVDRILQIASASGVGRGWAVWKANLWVSEGPLGIWVGME